MRLIFAIIALTMSNGACAQTLPGPEDYDAAVATALTDRFAYCWTGPATGAGTFASGLGLWITEDFPDAEAVDRETRQADGIAAIRRLIADGSVIHDAATLRLVECPATDWQIEERLRQRTHAFRRFSDEDGIDLLSGAMTAYGCSVGLEDEPAFLEFATRHVAGLYDIPLPDPLPQEEDSELTAFVEALFYVLDSAGTDMRRSGQMVTDDGVARLEGCVTSGAPPEATPVTFGTDPEAAAAHAGSLDVSDYLAILAQSFADVGCAVPEASRWVFASHFAHSGLAHIGVDLPAGEFVIAERDLALENNTDHPFGAAIAAFNYYAVLSPTLLEAENAGLIDYNASDAMVFSGCTPEGDLSILERYEIAE